MDLYIRVRFTSEILVASVFVYCLVISLACITSTRRVVQRDTSIIAKPHYANPWVNRAPRSAIKYSSTRCRFLSSSLSPHILLTVGSMLCSYKVSCYRETARGSVIGHCSNNDDDNNQCSVVFQIQVFEIHICILYFVFEIHFENVFCICI